MLSRRAVLLFFFVFYIIPVNVFAAVWTSKPSLSISENYSDNIGLVSDDAAKTSNIITVIKPQIQMSAIGRRLKLNLNYFLRHTDYTESAGNKIDSSTENYTFTAKAEPIRNELYVDAVARLSQVQNNQSAIITNNSLLTNNFSDIESYSITPTYRTVLFGQASVNLSYAIQKLRYVDSDFNGYTSFGSILNMASTRGSNSPLSWKLKYSNLKQKREKSPDETDITGELEIGYRLYKNIHYVAILGFVDYQYDNIESSSYESVGLSWQPSNRFELSFYAGKKLRRVSFSLRSSQRSFFKVIWEDAAIGPLPGESWQGSFNLQSNYFKFNVSHVEQITSFQRQRLANRPNINFPVTETIFRQNKNEISLATNRRRANIKVNIFNEDRGLVETAINSTDRDSQAKGGIVNISFNYSGRFSSSFLYGREDFKTLDNANSSNNDISYKQIYTEIKVIYRSRKKMTIEGALRKTQQIDKIIPVSAVSGSPRNFIENSASIKFTYSFLKR